MEGNFSGMRYETYMAPIIDTERNERLAVNLGDTLIKAANAEAYSRIPARIIVERQRVGQEPKDNYQRPDWADNKYLDELTDQDRKELAQMGEDNQARAFRLATERAPKLQQGNFAEEWDPDPPRPYGDTQSLHDSALYTGIEFLPMPREIVQAQPSDGFIVLARHSNGVVNVKPFYFDSKHDQIVLIPSGEIMIHPRYLTSEYFSLGRNLLEHLNEHKYRTMEEKVETEE